MARSSIEWTDYVWNTWWGCTEIAPECGRHFSHVGAVCYAALFASRGLYHRGVAASGQWTGLISPASETVWNAPLTWRQPARVFTCSMSDFWHEGVPLEWQEHALDVMEQTPHTYLVLTKRPGNVNRRLADLKRRLPANVWLGVTIGHEQSLPLLKPLRGIEATKKFLSCEPLLTPLIPGLNLTGIDWVITGGQSGARALPCDADSVRAIRDLCQRQRVAFFHKQWGTWGSNPTPRHAELAPEVKGGATLDGRLWREFPA